MPLHKSDYYNGIPKCVQYSTLADKQDFSNPFYLIPSNSRKSVVGSVYEIVGGLWELLILSYDPATGVLLGRPTLCPEQEPMAFKAIPIADGIKGMYMSGVPEIDNENLTRLAKLVNL